MQSVRCERHGSLNSESCYEILHSCCMRGELYLGQGEVTCIP